MSQSAAMMPPNVPTGIPLQTAPLPAPRLPALREELRLIPASPNTDGSPAWMIQDPIINKFYRIGWLEFEILLRWENGEIARIVGDVNAETTLHIEEADVHDLLKFLVQHHLIRADSPQLVNELHKAHQAKQQSAMSWLLHHYLFFRIPFIKPQRALQAAMPYLLWIYTPLAAWLVAALTATGLFLAVRQWDTFSHTFFDQLSWAGLASYAIALVCSKCLHELGHALTATRYGVRVAHMGIAMLVLFPMPYTDTSESWKLTNPKQRLNIASAGIITELGLAGIATLLWSLSPDGALKSALFFLATTSWVLTLAVNLSPFMRFDGYFILSDLLDFPNLHERSTALAKTWLRRTFLGFSEPWQESFDTAKRRLLIGFASITWVYRITVFLGIAWLVYYYFFKVLGIFLFIVEIAWFIVLPIWRECEVWIERRSEIKPNRIIVATLLLLGLLTLGMVPWQTTVRGEGWVHAARQSVIFTPIAGKLVRYRSAGNVQAGENLFQLTSPDIAVEAQRAQAQADAREQELISLTGQEGGEEKRANLQQQQARFNAEVKLYRDELDRMDLAAPFSGELTDLDDSLQQGGWVQPKQPLAMLIDPTSWVVDTFVHEKEVNRIRSGDAATVYLRQSRFTKLNGHVLEIEKARTVTLPNVLLDAQNGGNLMTLPGEKHTPQENLYKVRVALNAPPANLRMAAAHVHIETQGRAWLPDLFERIAAVLVRESGF